MRSTMVQSRSEEHTSELQSPCNLVCRLLLEKKKTGSGRNMPPRRGWGILGLCFYKDVAPAALFDAFRLINNASVNSLNQNFMSIDFRMFCGFNDKSTVITKINKCMRVPIIIFLKSDFCITAFKILNWIIPVTTFLFA